MKIDPERFWQQRERWPLNIDGHVFLGRAVLQVAKAQLEPPEPMTLPFSDRAQRTYDLAIERVAQEAAAGRLKTATLRGEHLVPIRPADWATLDRKTVFRCFFRLPGEIYSPGFYSESSWPIYVEAKSLTKFVELSALMAKAAEADAAFARVAADRYTFENQPDILPPEGFTSVDEALSAILLDDEAGTNGKALLRRLLRSGRTEAILQFWETGAIEGIPADFWATSEALSALTDNGIVAIPEPGRQDAAYSAWAYVRVREMSAKADPHLLPDQKKVGVDAGHEPSKGLLTKSERQTYDALVGAFGQGGGSNRKPAARAAGASAWANKQTPRAALPGELPRTIRRLDEKIRWPQATE